MKTTDKKKSAAAVCAVLCTAGLAGCGSGSSAGSPDVTATLMLENGTIAGNERDAAGILSFKGIPYAAAPVGDLRWKAPAPAQDWSGVRAATAYGNKCWAAAPYGGPVDTNGVSEDCLFLNVWSGARSSAEKRPVMVWIHGGGFQFGTSGTPIFDGTNLARKGAVVVSLNYRLGIFGYLATADLDMESGGKSSGMYGLLDQIAALKWVKRNIGKFGGDPGNVTVFGESAGSHAIGILMASPLAAGTFDKALGESGAFWESEHGPMPSHASAQKMGADFSMKAGAGSMAELRRIPAQRLAADTNWTFATDPGLTNFSPNIDGYVLPGDPYARYAAGKQNDVPLLTGWNDAEGVPFAVRGLPDTTREAYVAAATTVFGEANLDRFLQLYPAATDAQAKASSTMLIGDLVISSQNWAWATAQARTGKSPVYVYYFKQASPYMPVPVHSSEMPYVFGNLVVPNPFFGAPTPAPTTQDATLADAMSSYWVNFARTGNPNGSGLPDWPAYTGPGGRVMGLGATIQAEPETGTERFRFLNGFRSNGSLTLRF